MNVTPEAAPARQTLPPESAGRARERETGPGCADCGHYLETCDHSAEELGIDAPACTLRWCAARRVETERDHRCATWAARR